MTFISLTIIPLLVLTIIIHASYKKVNVYDEFVVGAKEGLLLGLDIFPYLLGMIFAINIFTKSNIINFVTSYIGFILELFRIPSQIIPLALMRPISGNASLAILNSIFLDFGPDSLIGKMASVLQGSTDTTLYVITIYFGSIGVTRIKHCLYTGLIADFLAVILSIGLINYFFG